MVGAEHRPRKGFRIVQVYSRTEESARELAQKVEAEYTTDLAEVNPYAKLYIVSLKDSAFAELLQGIVEGKREEALMVHTAGSIPMNVWEGHVSHYSTLSNRVYDADSEQRKSLHLAAVFTCNFTNHMYALAAELLKKYNLPFDVMLPLIDETARKVHELEPKTAQTGPAIRYDENVIGNHLRMLADDPAMQRLYELLSRSIHERQ